MSCFFRVRYPSVSFLNLPFLGLFLSLTLLNCGSPKEQASTTELPHQVNLVEAYHQKKEVPLSKFAESVEYIRLESTEEALIGQFPHFYLFGDYIISIAFRQVYLFDRKTGAFIKELKSYGDGPDEYRYTRSLLHADEKRGVVFVRDNRNIEHGVNIKGESVLRFKSPNDEGYYITGYAALSDDLFVGFHPNTACDQEVKLVVFNNAGQVINSFANQLECINYDPNSISFNSAEGAFYHWNDQVGFKETYNDTLFMVTADTLTAKAVFNSGDYGLPYEEKKKLQIEDNVDYHTLTSFDETDQYIFFQLTFRGETHSGLYDKRAGQTEIVRSSQNTIQGFTNDLDNFLPFTPYYATEKGELVGYLESPDVLNWLDENPEKAIELPQRLKELAQVESDDNPIVMIVKLKD